MAWLLASTLAMHEFDARDRLKDYGINTYVPQYRRSIQPRHTRSPRVVVYPVFARYLFLWLDNLAVGLDTLRQCSNVWPAHSDSGQNLFVNDHEINGLRQREAQGEFDQLDHAPHGTLTVGSPVTVSLGNLTRNAVVTHLLRKRRVRLLLDDSSIVITANVDLVSLAQ